MTENTSSSSTTNRTTERTPDAPKTLRTMAGLPETNGPFDEAALIVIDAQDEYLEHGGLPLVGIDEALNNIGSLLSAARARGTTIIHVAHQGSAGALFDPATGGKIIEPVAPSADELIVQKSLPNSFAGTDLATLLQERNINHLVLAGFMTHMCVSATARAALDLGFASTVVSDATASRSLPAVDGGQPIPAELLHSAALAGLADRFSVVTSTAAVLT